MKTIQLSKEERKFLMQLYKNSSDKIEKANTLSLLLSHRGISEKQIAKMLNVAPDSVNLLITLWKSTQEQEKYKFLHVDLLNPSMAYR
jgi:orotate phosphoribosyltransferase-like protein